MEQTIELRDLEEERTLNPFALLPENGAWYVIGFDVEGRAVTLREGDTIEDLTWTGYVDDNGNGNPFDDAPREISLEEFFHGHDPDAKILLINASAGWCGSCADEAPLLRSMHNDYYDKGGRVITALT